MPKRASADIGAAGADQAGEAEHLAAADVEADILEDALAAEVAHRQEQLALRRRRPLGEQPHLAPDHVGDRALRRRLGARHGRDQPAVAEHRDLVGDLEDLLQPVADEEDGDALVAEVADELEELGDLVRRERRGRLVHDQDADVERDRLGDLDRLLRGERQPARRAPHVERHAEFGEDRLGLAEHRAPVDDRAAALVADEDVLRDVEVGEEHRLLVDRGDAVALGLGGVADRDVLAGRAGSRRGPAGRRRS